MRNERYRSRSRERSQGDRYDYDEPNDRRREQDVQPNSTIMIRNLGLQITENEVSHLKETSTERLPFYLIRLPTNPLLFTCLPMQIMAKLSELGLRPKEIRLMRKKDTGNELCFDALMRSSPLREQLIY